MRVKQTARKSTGGTPDPRLRSRHDPVRSRIGALLATKRRSQTPGSSDGGNYRGAGNAGRGKNINNLVKVKPKRKARPGMVALREIKRLQNSHDNLIPRAPFHRVIREITQQIQEQHFEQTGLQVQYKYQAVALEALQEAAEAYIIRMLENSYLCTLHSGRVTLFVKDVQLCLRLQRNFQSAGC